MTKVIRKTRTLTQKQKRPTAHRVGKQFRVSSNNKSRELYPFLKTQMLLKTNKEYRMAEFQQVIGGLLGMGALMYIFGGCMYYFSVNVLKWYGLQFVNSITLGLLKPSPLEQFHSLTFWEVYEKYSMGQPIIVGIIVILLLVTGVVLHNKGKEKQNMIRANINDEKLSKDYEKLRREGGVTND